VSGRRGDRIATRGVPPDFNGLAAQLGLRQRANHAIDKRLGHFDKRVMRCDRNLA
jgi:hypothetical protein